LRQGDLLKRRPAEFSQRAIHQTKSGCMAAGFFVEQIPAGPNRGKEAGN